MYIDKDKYKTVLNLPKGTRTGLKCEGCGAELVIREGQKICHQYYVKMICKR